MQNISNMFFTYFNSNFIILSYAYDFLRLSGLFFILLSFSYFFSMLIIYFSKKTTQQSMSHNIVSFLFFGSFGLCFLFTYGFITTVASFYLLLTSFQTLRYHLKFSNIIVNNLIMDHKVFSKWSQEISLSTKKDNNKRNLWKKHIENKCANENSLWVFVFFISLLSFISSLILIII